MLQTLEKNGFILRKTDENDQRCIRIYITEKGYNAALKGEKAVEAADEQLFSRLSAEEQEKMFAMMQKLKEFLDDERKE